MSALACAMETVDHQAAATCRRGDSTSCPPPGPAADASAQRRRCPWAPGAPPAAQTPGPCPPSARSPPPAPAVHRCRGRQVADKMHDRRLLFFHTTQIMPFKLDGARSSPLADTCNHLQHTRHVGALDATSQCLALITLCAMEHVVSAKQRPQPRGPGSRSMGGSVPRATWVATPLRCTISAAKSPGTIATASGSCRHAYRAQV